MNRNPVFLTCESCKNVLEVVCCNDSDSISCCGADLKALVPRTQEGETGAEKHLPVVECEGNKVTVKVGNIYHPMTEEHSIGWVYLQTEKGCQRVCLEPSSDPVAEFCLTEGDKPVAAYAYCNLHGFWKTEL